MRSSEETMAVIYIYIYIYINQAYGPYKVDSPIGPALGLKPSVKIRS